jgi:hypothetical protein
MRESVCPPQRMRYSLESRCRIVGLILPGESPQAPTTRPRRDRLADWDGEAPLYNACGCRLSGSTRWVDFE